MSKHKDDRAYLWDMLEASRMACEFVQDKSFHFFLSDPLLQSGVERKLEIIGEAANRVSSDMKEKYSSIPWNIIIGQRHVLVHDYDEINYERIWNVCQKDLPVLIENLEVLLPKLTEECEDQK